MGRYHGPWRTTLQYASWVVRRWERDRRDAAEIARLREEQAGDELVPIEDVWRDLEAEPGHEQSAQLEP